MNTFIQVLSLKTSSVFHPVSFSPTTLNLVILLVHETLINIFWMKKPFSIRFINVHFKIVHIFISFNHFFVQVSIFFSLTFAFSWHDMKGGGFKSWSGQNFKVGYLVLGLGFSLFWSDLCRAITMNTDVGGSGFESWSGQTFLKSLRRDIMVLFRSNLCRAMTITTQVLGLNPGRVRVKNKFVGRYWDLDLGLRQLRFDFYLEMTMTRWKVGGSDLCRVRIE